MVYLVLFLPDFLWVTYLILDTSLVLICGPLLSHRGEAADDTERRRFRESAAIVWLPPAKYNPPSPYCHASCMDVTVVKTGSTSYCMRAWLVQVDQISRAGDLKKGLT